MSEQAENKKQMPIVKAVMDFLGLSQEGKLRKFFGQVIDQSKSAITALEYNIKKAEIEHEEKMASFERKIEDAKDALDNSYKEVDVDKIDTSESRYNYVSEYLGSISNKQKTLDDLMEVVEKEKQSHKELIDSYTNQIKAHKETIKNIENFKQQSA